jgi:tripartite-type tricarboxylate transporter receptor subunit TctC
MTEASAGTMATATLAVLLGITPAAAQDAAEFYRGKTITIIAATSAGGGIDMFARQLARHIVKHIPGNPQAVVTNMPGAGTKVAAKHIYAVAPKDGTTMGTVLPGALMEPMRVEAARRDYDPLRFNYIGNGNAEALTTVVRTNSGINSLDDLFTREMIAGTPGGGSSVHESTMMAKNILGYRLRVVTGYPGVREVALAMEKGEVHGMVGLAYSTARQFFPDHLTGEKGIKVIAQDNLAGHPVLNKAGIPLSISRAKTPADKAALELYQSQAVLVRVYIMPPGVPADRVAVMRKAFMDAVTSPEFQADITKANAEAVPQSGEEIQALITRMYASPPELVERVAKAIQ